MVEVEKQRRIKCMEIKDNYKKIKTFRDLIAWQEGHSFVLMIYETTKDFPREEVFGLTSQLRRAIVSCTSNVAEGFSRLTPNDKAHFYTMALGSLTEVQSQLEIAKDIGYIEINNYNELELKAIKIHKVLNGLIKGTRFKKFLNS